ncbi:MAG: glycerol-3-phosphate 1-O-acyltransferase PlsY [Candidatus Paceibacterota bacterium]|jgi:glycerol-3-phosphate acyltransferase PlsY
MQNLLILLILILLGYLSGSIPFGYLISKTKNIDIRKQGSGNIGATNVSRFLGLKYAILVGILDIAKAVLPIYIGSLFFQPGWELALISIAPVMGHLFPVWLKFKGGKAVSVIFASIIMVMGWQYSLILLGIWIISLFLIKIMSLTNIIIFIIVPFIFWHQTHSYIYVALGIFYVLIIWWAHRENIKRLIAGTEPKLIKK